MQIQKWGFGIRGISFVYLQLRWITSTDHAFKLRIVNIEKVVQIPRCWVKCFNNFSLLNIRKKHYEISFTAETNQLQEKHYNYCLIIVKIHNKFLETSSQKGNDRSHESSMPRSICPKTLCSPSLIPMMLHIKFDQDWPTGFRDIQVQKVWNFRHSRTSNSKMSRLNRPKTELDWAFMPVLVISNFDDDSIKNEQASIETPFSHYKCMGNFLDAQGS